MFPHAVKPFSKSAKCLMYHFFYYPFVIGQQMKANYFYINFLPILLVMPVTCYPAVNFISLSLNFLLSLID